MQRPRVDKTLMASAGAHAAVLLWAGLSFAAKPFETKPTEAVFVDTISLSEFSEMMAGSKSAPKKEAPKPLVEKKAEPKPVEHQDAKVSEKQEVVASAAAAAPPPKPAPPKPVQEAKPAPKAVEPAKKPVEKKPDAESLTKVEKKEEIKKPEHKKEEPKKEELKKEEPKKEEAKKPVPEKQEAKVAPRPPEPKAKPAEPRPEQERSKFDASKIAALLDKRQPQRLASAGDVINHTAALGAPTGTAAKLSQNEIDALRARIQQCWNPPAGMADARELTVQVRIQFNQDGTLASEPRLVSRVAAGYQQVAAESALRAIRRCAPYSFMPVAKYDAWKDVEVTFDPRDLFRG